MKKKIIVVLCSACLSLCCFTLSFATTKSITIVEDFDFLSVDATVLLPPEKINTMSWEIDWNIPKKDFFQKYHLHNGEKFYVRDNKVRGTSYKEEISQAFSDRQFEFTNGKIMHFPMQNAPLCKSVGDFSATQALEMCRQVLKDYNPNIAYYLFYSDGVTTQMVNENSEKNKNDPYLGEEYRAGRLLARHLDGDKVYYMFHFLAYYDGFEIFNGEGGSTYDGLDLDARFVVSNEGFEYVSLQPPMKFKTQSSSFPVVSINECLNRLNHLEEIASKHKKKHWKRKTIYKAQVGLHLAYDEYGSSVEQGDVLPIWRLSYTDTSEYSGNIFIDAQTGELYIKTRPQL